jgi:hypothetical protein
MRIGLFIPCYIDAFFHHAYHRPESRDGHYAVLHTEPSATADIEGVLIHGTQGIRSLSVLSIAQAIVLASRSAPYDRHRNGIRQCRHSRRRKVFA